MSNPYDPIYRECVERIRIEIAALIAERASIEVRLKYIRKRKALLASAIEALNAVLECVETKALAAIDKETV